MSQSEGTVWGWRPLGIADRDPYNALSYTMLCDSWLLNVNLFIQNQLWQIYYQHLDLFFLFGDPVSCSLVVCTNCAISEFHVILNSVLCAHLEINDADYKYCHSHKAIHIYLTLTSYIIHFFQAGINVVLYTARRHYQAIYFIL